MNHRDLTLKQRSTSSDTAFFALPNLLFGLYGGAVGGLFNAFLGISFFGSFSLYLGQVFVLLCLMFRGINAAIIAVAISSLVTSVYAGDPYLIIIFALEVFAVHVLLKRGFFLLTSVIIYWACVGIPLLLLLSILTSDTGAQVLFINGLTRAINGLICVSVASIVCWLLPASFFKHQYNVRPPKLASLIFSLCMLTVTLPALLISLFFIYQSSAQNEAAVQQSLKSSAKEISQILQTTLNAHIQSLASLSSYISSGGQLSEARQILANLSTEHVNFSSTMVLDSSDNIAVMGPSTIGPRLSLSRHKYLIDHPSYHKARNEINPVISSIISEDIMLDDAAILLLAPIVKNAQYAGMTAGVFAVSDVAATLADEYLSPADFIVIDKERNVLASSLQNPSSFDTFNIVREKHPLISSVPMLTIAQNQFLYYQHSTDYGWQILTLTSPQQSTAEMMDNFFILFICATLLLLSFALIANQLSKKITRPLEDIAGHFPDKKLHPSLLEEAKVSIEMVSLAETLVSSHAVISDFHQQLTQQVDNETRQLKQLNKELYSLAQKDSLTQLLNRAGFNRFALGAYRHCVRNRISMSLILIDIDHFKKINDSHGHQFGDKCIIRVSQVLQEHCKRDTDIIGRFGGEEFIIMITGKEIAEHHERMQLIKDSISQARFKHNNEDVRMSVSAGILSVSTDYAIDFESMIKLADEQLYLSKRTGRNKISTLIC